MILQALVKITKFRNIFVMGISHSIDLSSMVESSLLKRLGWQKPEAIPILPHHFICTRNDLSRVLKCILPYGDYIDQAMNADIITMILPLRARILSEILLIQQEKYQMKSKITNGCKGKRMYEEEEEDMDDDDDDKSIFLIGTKIRSVKPWHLHWSQRMILCAPLCSQGLSEG